jgi:hypothetical protein
MKLYKLSALLSSLATLLFGALAVYAHNQPDDEEEPGVDMRRLAQQADFVFKGEVVGVQYRDSESEVLTDDSGAPILDEDGQPALRDGSEVPYSFVTFEIEKIYKGNASGSTVTLRFFGGVAADPWVGRDEDGNMVSAPQTVEMEGVPLFDVGDRDILFVEGNTEDDCPLVDCENGRFRLLTIPAEDGEGVGVYSDQGFEVVEIASAESKRLVDSEVGVGRFRPGPDVMTHTYAAGLVIEATLELTEDDDASLPSENLQGTPFEEKRFGRFLKEVVRQTHSRSELRALPPVVSADATQPFQGASGDEAVPEASAEVEVPEERPWLDLLTESEREAILEEERIETEALAANDDNPVLPADR